MKRSVFTAFAAALVLAACTSATAPDLHAPDSARKDEGGGLGSGHAVPGNGFGSGHVVPGSEFGSGYVVSGNGFGSGYIADADGTSGTQSIVPTDSVSRGGNGLGSGH